MTKRKPLLNEILIFVIFMVLARRVAQDASYELETSEIRTKN